MKKILFILFLASSAILFAQNKMYIHRSDNITSGILLSVIDSIYFSSNGSTLSVSSGNNISQFPLSEVDSISFAESSDTVYVNYSGNSVSVLNPLAFENVSVKVNGAYVTIISKSENKDINYKISGTTANGMLKVYSDKRFNLFMNGVSITNLSGPAVNLQSNNKASVTLVDGTVNSLTDGNSYADSVVADDGSTEDQNSAFYSKGKLAFGGTGSLVINGSGNNKHALFSKDLIEFNNASLTIPSASKDGIHSKDGIIITGGKINITAAGDAIDADKGFINIAGGSVITKNSAPGANGIICDSTMDISNAEINISISSDQSKAIKSGQNMTLSSGNITILTSGAAVLETSGSGYEPSYCTAIKCDSTITINGANIKVTSSGKGAKGISSDKNINITSGIVNITTSGAGATYKNASGITDCYNAICITANGNVNILGGNVTVASSGAAGKGITSNGTLTIGDAVNLPEVNITTSGSKITISGSGMNAEYAESKAISCDGAVTINNGTVTISSADDGIKSKTSVTINNGTVSINKSVEGIESPYITVNAGNVSIVSSDDGFNATKGNGGESNDGSCLYLRGGNINVNTSAGDGLDSNGSMVMSGGTVVVNGPQSSPEVGIDYNGTFNVSGGFLLVSGPNSGNMIQATSTTSSQYSIKAATSSMISTSTIFHIQDAAGNNVATFKPVRNAYYIVLSSPEFKNGATYYIYTGGTSTGTNTNGLYAGGTYSGGTLKKSFTISGAVTSVSF